MVRPGNAEESFIMKLQSTLSGAAPTIDVSCVLQLLESQRANGTFSLGDLSLRLAAGQVVKASGEPIAVVAALVSTTGRFEFRATPGAPSGSLRLSVTGLLLEAARLVDESAAAVA